MKRIRAIQIFLIAAVLVMCISFISVATSAPPTVYKNDTKYAIDEFPAENVDGKVFVPINFFIGFDDVQYEYSSNPIGFYFRNEKTGRYFSFSSSSTFIVVDGEFTDVSFPILNSTIYMPLDYCAKILSLDVEYKSDDNARRVRVTDGTHKLPFDELIELYDPTEQPEDPPTTEPNPPIVIPNIPPVTEPVAPTPESRNIYITFDVTDGEYAMQVFDILMNQGCTATFFFNAEQIRNYPEAVIRAFVSGHSIGIDGGSTLKETNKVLYDVLHIYTRIAKASNDSTLGYISRPINIDSRDISSESEGNIARSVYNQTFKHTDSVISIPTDKKSVGIVKQLLYYINADEYATVLPILPTSVANAEVN